MDEYEANSVAEWYEALETELLEFLSVVPPVPENLGCHSPRLAGIILQACGLLDSLFRQITPDPVMLGGVEVVRKDLNITHYAHLYTSKFGLAELRSIVLITPPGYEHPFEEWSDVRAGGEYKPCPWWQTYNDLKHDRIAHLREGTLELAGEALCGLHQVIAKAPELAGAFLRRGWIHTGPWNPEVLLGSLTSRGKYPDEFLAESKLFVVPLGSRPFPPTVEEFRPGFYNGSRRLREFFGRW